MDNQKVAKQLVKIAKSLLSEDVQPNFRNMTINDIGYFIVKNWKPMNFGAKPYAEAMKEIDNNGMYIMDSWESVVAYWLSNASTWRGPVAKAVKAELKRRLKSRKRNG